MSSAICFNLDLSKILSSGNVLTSISNTSYNTFYTLKSKLFYVLRNICHLQIIHTKQFFFLP